MGLTLECLDPNAPQDMQACTKDARWGGVSTQRKTKCEHKRIKCML